jgi:hypothetical protein
VTRRHRNAFGLRRARGRGRSQRAAAMAKQHKEESVLEKLTNKLHTRGSSSSDSADERSSAAVKAQINACFWRLACPRRGRLWMKPCLSTLPTCQRRRTTVAYGDYNLMLVPELWNSTLVAVLKTNFKSNCVESVQTNNHTSSEQLFPEHCSCLFFLENEHCSSCCPLLKHIPK